MMNKLKKTMCVSATAALLSLPAAGQADAKDAAAEKDLDPFMLAEEARAVDPMVQIQVELIEVAHATLSELMFMRDPQANATPLREKLQTLISQGKAEVIDTLVSVSTPNQKVASESVREFIYPTEYEPAEIPNEVRIQGAPAPDLTRLMTPPTPTAFETRNVGSTLESEATLGTGNAKGLIWLQLAPEVVVNTGNITWLELKDRIGNNHKILMPAFYTNRLNTKLMPEFEQLRIPVQLAVPNGRYAFGGLFSRSNSPEKRIMVFVRCDVLTM